MDDTDRARLQALVELYKEQGVHGRHTESQRQAVTMGLLAAAGVFVAAISGLKFEITSAPLAILLILLGLFGQDFVSVYEFKWDEASARRGYYRQKVLDLIGETPISDEAIAAYFQLTKDAYLKKRDWNRLRHRWQGIFWGISASGAVLLTIILKVYFS